MSGRFFRQPVTVNAFDPVAHERQQDQGPWIPACGGTETPFRTRTGRTLLYCWQPTSGRHAYLDMGTDLILSDEEASNALAK